MKTKLLPVGAAVATVVVLVGCKGKSMDEANAGFTPTDEKANVFVLLDRQSDLGAAEDATIYAMHFDGAELNSLGTTKLDAIRRATPASTNLQVYVNLSESDELADARQEAIETYLDQSGVVDEKRTITMGVNPNVRTPADRSVAALNNLSKANAASAGDANVSVPSGLK